MSILNWINILWELSNGEIESLEMFCQERFVEAWEDIFAEWDLANSMYILKSWKVEVYKSSSDWSLILWHIEADNIFWEMALFWNESKRMAWTRALVDSVLVVIIDFSLKKLFETHPAIMDKIKKIIEERNEKNKEIL